MSTKLDFSVPPYNDDYDPTKDYYKHLFRPGVSVQVRELNQLQTILQSQIEKFGDVIFRKGSIIDGCNFSFFDNYNYVVISDNTLDNVPAVPSLYEGFYVRNSSNLVAMVVNSLDGYSTTSEQRKTLYITYVNSGDSGTDTQFSPGDLLTVYSPNDKILDVDVTDGGVSFANSESVVFVPKIEVSQDTGSFANGEYLIQSDTGANAQIINIANGVNGYKILTLKPRTSDLTNNQVNSAAWTFDLFSSVRNAGNTAVGTVKFIYGSGAKGSIRTNSSGRINDVNMTSYGKGYSELPYVTVKSTNNSTGLSSLNLTARNYLTKIKASSSGDAVGNGYAFSVSEGTIYQKGYFLRVAPQLVVVSKYSNSPNNVSVVFQTTEEIVDSNIDTSLLDNATGEYNENAPGANRLKLTPTLTVVNTDIAIDNDEYLPLVQWNNGNPYKQSHFTIYSKIGDEMARRDYERSGNYVLDPFFVTTDCISNTQLEGQYFTIVTDPGTAYISGYRTETRNNFRIDVPKATTTSVANNQKVSLNYGSYIRIKEVGGVFQFSTGDSIDLYSTAKGFLSNISLAIASNTTPQGVKIGTARIRSMVLENGIPGEANAVYRLFLFNISMNAGANFKNIRSVYYNGSSYKGIADVVLDLDPTTSANIAKLQDPKNDQLVFNTGIQSIKVTTNTNYVYRTIDQTATTGNNGLLTKSIASSPDEFFPYSGSLSTSQLKELYVVPVGNNLVQYDSLTGTVNANTSTSNLVGTSTSFISEVEAGDYVYIYSNSVTYDIRKVISVVNNTLLTLDANCTIANSASTFKRIFPKNVPIPFGIRSGLTANVNSNGNILTLNYGITFEGTTSVNTAIAVNIQRTDTTATTKTSNRNRYVKLRLANNDANTIGPWCIGIPDIFRLRSVYIGNSSVSNTDVNVVSEFYIDHNQTPNYLDLSYLYLKPKSSLSLSSDDYLLVEFDHFTSSGAGYYDTSSYLGTSNSAQIASIDSLPLANLSSAACSWEIPEIFAYDGKYYNLNNTIDFRPYVVNTAISTTNSSAATINPAYTVSFGNTVSSANDKKFPLPDDLFISDIEQYMGRIDDIIIGPDGNVVVAKGTPSADPSKRYEPNLPEGVMKLQTVEVPPYPNVAKNLSNNMVQILATNIANEISSKKNLKDHTVMPTFTANNIAVNQPTTYTMEDIGALERRISDLEFYNRLNLLETSIANKVIPSSIDGTINRFKFGFFVDDFSTTIYSARTNPQYNADIEPANLPRYASSNTVPQLASNFCVPPKFRWALTHVVPPINSGHIDELVISQNIATEVEPLCILVEENIEDTGGMGYAFHTSEGANEYRLNPSISKWNAPVHLQSLKMSNTHSGNGTMYTTVFETVTEPPSPNVDPDDGGGYDPAYRIYQGNNVIATSANAVAFTIQDWDFLNSNQYTRDFIRSANRQRAPFQKLTGAAALYGEESVVGSAKLNFYHNHLGESDYTILVESFPLNSEFWWNRIYIQYIVVYPASDETKGVIISDICSLSPPTKYNGTMTIDTTVSNRSLNWYDKIKVSCTGLKPNSIHNFYIDGTINNSNLQPDGKALGDPLISDPSGKLSFTFFFDQSWKNALSLFDVTQIYDPSLIWGWWFEAGRLKTVDGYNFSVNYTLFEVATVNSQASSKLDTSSPNRLL